MQFFLLYHELQSAFPVTGRQAYSTSRPVKITSVDPELLWNRALLHACVWVFPPGLCVCYSRAPLAEVLPNEGTNETSSLDHKDAMKTKCRPLEPLCSGWLSALLCLLKSQLMGSSLVR